MGWTFAHCLNFNGDISMWDVSSVTTVQSMFLNNCCVPRGIGGLRRRDAENLFPHRLFQSRPQTLEHASADDQEENAHWCRCLQRRAPAHCPARRYSRVTAFAVGDAVEADYSGHGAWFAGVVLDVQFSDNSYDIKYDDGDSQEHVAEARLRRPSSER